MTAARLATLLRPHAVEPAALEARYGAINQLLRRMLGTVPHSGRYMEIWPPAFRTECLIVPNLLDVPFSVFGLAAPMPLVGLAMYSSSKAAQCMYCTAHCCTFALRRGLSPEAIAAGAVAAGHLHHHVGAPVDRPTLLLVHGGTGAVRRRGHGRVCAAGVAEGGLR